MTRSDLVDIAVIIHHETKPEKSDEGAILVSDDGVRKRAVWIPKAAIEIEHKAGCTIITLPECLAKEKGLI